ncbi:FadR/GntR family transcriptional regulator [Rhizobium rhizophilum]|uniref:FadR family transcriptional regulator n=1 Tax=Rhizobium rhizophilum TaxID=1850373 RepID=A0ABY2QSN0_9HYPH|nr:FadR/GntR family transcriptional regulator [Rhizobium rhizophilum]THV13469.1 FadR family transcriptional regulator [Rhizobium rhizophilum]
MRKDDVRDLRVVTNLRTSHAKVVEKLGLAIVGGRFGIGEPLPGDNELESELDVSRSVLREAMKTLAAKGLVVAKSRVGTRVTERCHWNLIDEDVLRWHFTSGVTREFIDHLYDIRMVLEPASAAFAALRATPEDCVELRHYANLLGSNELDWPSQVEADLRFHVLLTIAGANPFLESMVGFIKASLDGAFTMAFDPDLAGRGEAITELHLAIVDALEKRDPEAARVATGRAIQQGRAAALKAVDTSSNKG